MAFLRAPDVRGRCRFYSEVVKIYGPEGVQISMGLFGDGHCLLIATETFCHETEGRRRINGGIQEASRSLLCLFVVP